MTAYLFDLDGTLYQGDAAIPGAPELIARLRRDGIPFRFVTNTTSKPRSAIVTRLRGYGFALEEEEVFTALRAGLTLAQEMGCDSIVPLVPPASLEDLAGFNLVELVVNRKLAGGAFPLFAIPPNLYIAHALFKRAHTRAAL